MESLFLPVTSLWQVLGAIDDDERLTALGWWGLPEAMLRVWAASATRRASRLQNRRRHEFETFGCCRGAQRAVEGSECHATPVSPPDG